MRLIFLILISIFMMNATLIHAEESTVDNESVRELKGHKATITDLVFSEDGKYLVSSGGAKDNRIIAWDVKTGSVFKELTGSVNAIAVSSDLTMVASGGTGNNIKLYSLDSGRIIKQFPTKTNSVLGVNISNDCKWLVSYGYKTLEIISIEQLQRIKTIKAHSDNIYSAVFDESGNTIISAGNDPFGIISIAFQ